MRGGCPGSPDLTNQVSGWHFPFFSPPFLLTDGERLLVPIAALILLLFLGRCTGVDSTSSQGVHCVLGAVLGANDIRHCSLGTYPQVPLEVKEKEVKMKQNNPPPDPPSPYISIPTILIRQRRAHANKSLPWEEKYLRTNMGFPLK